MKKDTFYCPINYYCEKLIGIGKCASAKMAVSECNQLNNCQTKMDVLAHGKIAFFSSKYLVHMFCFLTTHVVDRPGVAGTVLQTLLSFINV